MNPVRKRVALVATLTAIVVASGGLVALRAYADPKPAAAAVPPAAAVDVAEVRAREIVDWQGFSGRLEAVDRVEIRPLVSGTLTAVHFEDGALVKKGQLLFTIDPRPYQAELSRTQGQLAAAEARAAYTASDLARGERLVADNAIAKRDLDEKRNAAREAAANLQAAQAAVEAARLNLDYTRITAPVTGRVSRAEVTVGNVVAAGAAAAPLTTLVSTDEVYAAFDVDEQTFLKWINPSRASGQGKVPVFLGLANEDGFPREGKVSSVDNRIDVSSGTIRVRAVFKNPDGLLLPGLYARVRLGSGAPREALLIDEKAIGTDQDKRFVLVAGEDNHVSYRAIQLGAMHEGQRIVDAGLKPGERIVVNGLQRVRPGDAIAPQVVPMQAEGDAPGAAKAAEARGDKPAKATI